MTTAHDATSSFDCKTPGCTGEARSNRGKYAYLCDHCIRTKKADEPAPQPRPRATTPTESFEQAAKQLVPIGKKVDRAFAAADRAKEACKPAIQRAQAAKEHAEQIKREFFDAVRALLDGGAPPA